MELQIRKREKVNLGTIRYGQAFKMVDSEKCYVVASLLAEAALKAVINEEAAYCMDVETGIIIVLDRNLIVHPLDVEVIEK